MAQRKRRAKTRKRPTTASKTVRAVSRKSAPPKHGAAKKRGRRASRLGRAAQRQKNFQRAAFELFDRQIDTLWKNLVSGCQQFAKGYNTEIGATELIVDSHPDTVLLRFSPTPSEVFLQLDRSNRQVTCILNTEFGSYGSSIRNEAPVGFTVHNGNLRFVFAGSPISEEDLAVKLLTDMTGAGDVSRP